MKVGEARFWTQKHTRQRLNQYRASTVVNKLKILIFLLQLVKIFAFQEIRSVCIRHKFTTGCDRIDTKSRNKSSRLFGTRMMNENVDKGLTPLGRLGLPEPLLLGSASFTRKLILKEMGVEFTKFVRPIDEKALGDRSEDAPRELVLLLANAKMDRLVQELNENKPDDLPEPKNEKNKGWVILTGDQVVTCAGKILEKPESIEEAKEFVRGYAHSPPSTVGSVVLYHHPSGIRVEGVDTATIYFNPETLGGEGSGILVDQLIKEGEPIMSCAGGLMIEHPLTQNHVDRIDGTEDSVMGLSKDLVLRLMQELAEKLAKES